ncbi:hypothetical protein [Streptomyces sp. STR69]|uniref:hypothetical protein n=1 Tax=Streptomyces sp. STR69 TaxID=1796942 RepID=UPI0021C5AD63|nr:hypothetical protein [Streptomyces sp. STR69]
MVPAGIVCRTATGSSTASPHCGCGRHPTILALLDDVSRLGFALVRGVPAELDGMQALIDLIGFLRVTDNGAIEDIKALPPVPGADLGTRQLALRGRTGRP